METLGFAQTIFPTSKLIRQDEAVPSNLLWHTCGKLQNLNLEGNAAMKVVSTRLVGKLVMSHFDFSVFDVNWLIGTLRKGIPS